MPLPMAQQFGAIHVLRGPAGSRAVFNDPSDADYVGVLDGTDAVTGLDGAEIRTALYEKTQGDGSVAGPFFSGDRPITLKPTIIATNVSARNAREDKLRRVLDECMYGPGTLTWTPDGGVSSYVSVQPSQPLRITGGWAKSAQIGLIAPNPLILSTEEFTTVLPPATNGTLTNEGSTYSPPHRFRIHGPGTGPQLLNSTTGRSLYFTSPNLVLTSTEYLDVDVLNGTCRKGTLPIANPSAEVDTAGWSSGASTYWVNAGATLSRTTTAGEFHGGVAGFKVVTTASPFAQGMATSVGHSFVAGRTYTFSARVRAPVGASMRLGIGDGTVGTGDLLFTGTGAFQRVQCSFTAIASAASGFAIRNDIASAITFYADEFLLIDSGAVTTSAINNIAFPGSADWWTLKPGANTVRLNWVSGSSALSTLRTDWRHAWK